MVNGYEENTIPGAFLHGDLRAESLDEIVALLGRQTAELDVRPLAPQGGYQFNGIANDVLNRNVDQPYKYVGIWVIDQWRKIGLTVNQEVIEAAAYYQVLRSGDFEVAMDFQCGYIVDPDLDLYKFLSVDKNPSNYSRYVDRTLDELYEKQSRATNPEERKQSIRQFEKRLLDDEAHYLMTLQWHRIIPHSSKVKGWMITPSHYLNQQLDTVWLIE